MPNPQSAIRKPQSPPRFGLFGGSFDPVHLGHLMLANCCRQQATLDQIWFVPAAQQPLKPQGPQAADQHRLAMLQLACADDGAYAVSEIELRRGGISYTVDTLQAVRDEQPKTELFFLMGADSLADLPYWHRPAEICQLATPLVVRRAGTSEPDFEVLQGTLSTERLAEIRQSQVEMPATPISSSQIRESIAKGDPWREFVPAPVADYIQQHGLYGAR
jgi:nicotinate-nucleotide adenylyltransferase